MKRIHSNITLENPQILLEKDKSQNQNFLKFYLKI